jgi:nucleoside-diphosphate-sugar epimerase
MRSGASSAASGTGDVARCLIVGCGCRGLHLARRVQDAGHAVRATTRRSERVAELEAAGVEAVVARPDLVMTIAPAFAHVGVTCLLLGSARGSSEELVALHTTRLDMLLERMLDTTVRAIVYEAAGSVPDHILQAGADRVRHACRRSLIPHVILTADPADHVAWVAAAAAAVDRALNAGGYAADGVAPPG